MTDQEYRITVESLVVNGRGFQAIKDLSEVLSCLSAHYDTTITKYSKERNNMVAICDDPYMTNKAKVNSIRRML